MTECIYCRTTCNDGEMPCPNRDSAETCAWFTESDRRAISVSDEQPKAEDPKGLSLQGASAVTEGQTPSPIPPSEDRELVERLRAEPYYERKPLDYGLMDEAAERIERLLSQLNTIKGERDALQSQVHELTREDEDNPILAAILRVRHRNACNFAPSHSGSLGEARDDSLMEVYKEVRSALTSQTKGEAGNV